MCRPSLVPLVLLVLAASSCAKTATVGQGARSTIHGVETVAQAPTVETSGPAKTSSSASTTPPLSAPVSRCRLPAEPTPSADAPSVNACHPTIAVLQTAVRASLVKRFEKEHSSGHPQVDFSCDGLGPRIREVVVESGEGHGFDLEMWRARLSEDGAHYDVRGIAYSEGGYIPLAPGALHYQLSSGQLGRSIVAPAIERARAALAADIHEVVPPDPLGTSDGMSMSFSSEDFHVLVKLTDTDGRSVEKEFTGYRNNGDQESFLPVDLAAEKLAVMTKAFPFLETEAVADDRALFAERLRDARARMDEDFHWWVTERFVALSMDLGSPANIPDLLTRLKLGVTDRSKVDARANALEALARITQWDARVDDAGQPRNAEAASVAYLGECLSP